MVPSAVWEKYAQDDQNRTKSFENSRVHVFPNSTRNRTIIY
jgi:hypothetical protein